MSSTLIKKALTKATGIKNPNLEFSSRPEFGDYTTNIALHGKNPREEAEKILGLLKKDKSLKEIVEKIEIAGPGFINFHLSTKVLSNNLSQIIEEKENYGKTKTKKKKKIMLEYGDANTHKLPHIGHLFSYIYGESIIRILEAAGAEIRRVSYQGDVGLHVAKCLWAYQKENPKVPASLEEKVYLLQKMYQLGSEAYEDNEKAKEEIVAINKSIYDPKDKIKSLWEETRKWSVDYYTQFEKQLGINYDRHYYESEVYEKGKEIVEKNLGKVFTKSEGAIIFEGHKYGLHDRVFVTKYETPTYEAKDMYLQELKVKEWPMDLLIIATASEQNGYFEVIFKALETLDPKFSGILKHIGFGMINLKSGKMSSRTGNIISAVDLIKETVKKVEKLNKDKKIAEEVGLGAIKYSFLKNNPLQNVSFSIEESISKEGNSGPYLQYTYARIQSVLKKGKEAKYNAPGKDLNAEELMVLRTLFKYPEIISMAASTFSPNLLCEYLYNLASTFNTFYNKHKIIDGENEQFDLELTAGCGQILKNGLTLLGIATPEKM